MNYVAHQFLSFQNPKIQLGNLYGDIVRGNHYENYQGFIKTGILLHREIDSFTDNHPATKRSTQIFHKRFSKFSPVIVDVVYDYILIKNWNKFSDLDFDTFTNDCYDLFQNHLAEFPEKLHFIIQHLLKHDWFRNYQSLEGIQQTLKGISQRSKFPNEIYLATEEIEEHYTKLENDFLEFFPEIIQHCQNFIQEQISEFNRIL